MTRTGLKVAAVSVVLLALGIMTAQRGGGAPVIDDEVRKAVVDRVSLLQKQICLGVRGYPELSYLHPTWVEFTHTDPKVLVDISVNSAFLSQVLTRETPNSNTGRSGRDETFIHIHARVREGTPQTNKLSVSGSPGPLWTAEVRRVYQETLPVTGIVITVDAASTDGRFPELVRDSLEQPVDRMKSEIAVLVAKVETEFDSFSADALLVRVGEYQPVISALTNTNIRICQNAIIALAHFNSYMEDGTVIKNAVSPLIHLLKYPDPYTRYLAAWALGNVRQEENTTVAALLTAVDDEDDQTASAALASLAYFKSQQSVIAPKLQKKFSKLRPSVRLQAYKTLNELTPGRDSHP